MVNKAILVGNLGKDPEVRHLESGSVVCNFSLATNESYKNKNGEKVTQTEWHNIELWDGLAKVAEQYLKQGSTVYIEGKIRSEQWTDNEGNNRKTTKIRANHMTMLGGGNSGGQSNGQQQSKPQTSNQTQNNPPVEDFSEEPDDLPF